MRQLSGTESCRTLVGVALAGAAMAASMLMAAPAAAQVTRLSETASATAGDKSSRDVSVSEDGRFVAFTSDATNLVAGDTNGVSDAFVKDRTTGAVTRVSVGTGDTQAVARSRHPVFSANGRYVAFATESSLDPADAGACSATVSSVACVDVYVHDRQTGVTTLASPQPSLGGPVPRGVSPDGRYTLLAVKGLMDGPAGRTTYEVITTYDAVGHTTTLLFEQPIQEDAPVYGHAALSGDGRLVVASVALENAQPDPLPCTSPDRCRRLYIRDALGSPGVTRIDPTIAIRAGERSVDLELLDLSANGRHVLFMASINHGTPRPSAEYGAYVHDRATGITRRVDDTFAPYRVGAVSEDGQTVATCTASPYSGAGYMKLYDRFREEAIRSGASPHTCETAIAISGDGRFVFFDSRQSSELPSDPAATAHIYAFDRDEDGDGMSSAWELLFGLDPTVATDASLDADGDGQTNLQEYRAISHPAGAVRRYFAEGAANDFFRTAFNLFNPHATAVVAQLTMVNEGGERSMATVPIPAGGALSVPVYGDPIAPAAPELTWGRAQAPGQAFSTVIESEKLLVAERTMRWGWTDGGYAYGSHAETAIVEPRRDRGLARDGAAVGRVWRRARAVQRRGDVSADCVARWQRRAGDRQVEEHRHAGVGGDLRDHPADAAEPAPDARRE